MKIKTQKSLIKLGEKLSKNQLSVKSAKPRNHVALSPLMKKGRLHDKDNAAFGHKKQRRQSKVQLRRMDWFGDWR